MSSDHHVNRPLGKVPPLALPVCDGGPNVMMSVKDVTGSSQPTRSIL